MTTALEIAIEVLPHFAKSVLAGHVYSYGHYTTAVGRETANESMIIGQAMHVIGGACILCAIPVAPLHFVQRADGSWPAVFEADSIEAAHVRPHYDLLYVTARDFDYTSADFLRLESALRDVLPKYLHSNQLSPHEIWRYAIRSELRDGGTPFKRALNRYKGLVSEATAKRLADQGTLAPGVHPESRFSNRSLDANLHNAPGLVDRARQVNGGDAQRADGLSRMRR